MTRLALLALLSALVALATVVWIVSHGRRELPMANRRLATPKLAVEPEDDVQPPDPWTWEQLYANRPETTASGHPTWRVDVPPR